MREAYTWTREKALNGFALGTFIVAAVVFVCLLYYLNASIVDSGHSCMPGTNTVVARNSNNSPAQCRNAYSDWLG